MNEQVQTPAGFSGWWCARCEQACPSIPADLDAAQARCPHCHKWTAVWIPPGQMTEDSGQRPAGTARARANEARALSAGVEWERQQPTAERAKELFQHIENVIENPGLEPDLKKIEDAEYKR